MMLIVSWALRLQAVCKMPCSYGQPWSLGSEICTVHL
uniref:Uncharacterized protein n=1 Tax=Anguilla anguilla TaxID=7936 RepID=A0A0E9QDV0_ANGAN